MIPYRSQTGRDRIAFQSRIGNAKHALPWKFHASGRAGSPHHSLAGLAETERLCTGCRGSGARRWLGPRHQDALFRRGGQRAPRAPGCNQLFAQQRNQSFTGFASGRSRSQPLGNSPELDQAEPSHYDLGSNCALRDRTRRSNGVRASLRTRIPHVQSSASSIITRDGASKAKAPTRQACLAWHAGGDLESCAGEGRRHNGHARCRQRRWPCRPSAWTV